MRMRVAVVLLATFVVLALAIVAGVASPASASEYPSWNDVKKAKASEAAKAAEVTRIKGLLTASKAAAAKAEQEAEAKGAVYQAFRDRVDTANDRLAVIKAEVAADDKKAKAAGQRAGQLAAQLSRSGGADLQTSLFLSQGKSGSGAADFLDRLGQLSKLTEANASVAQSARTAQRSAAATQAQFASATDALVALKQQAKGALDDALAASAAANAIVAKQQSLQATMQAQLAALQDTTSKTIDQYKAGVAARRAASGGAAGAVNSQGWALPAAGPITDPFGYRPDRPAGANPFHHGTDIGGGCSNPIYAAHAGTVIYAGWLGTYGNFIEISNGGGISTGYAHIRFGGTFVHVGESVRAGQNIASIGTTGASTGCHLHFEVRIDEVPTDPVPFMAARGVTIG